MAVSAAPPRRVMCGCCRATRSTWCWSSRERASSPAPSPTWCWAAPARWPTSRHATTRSNRATACTGCATARRTSTPRRRRSRSTPAPACATTSWCSVRLELMFDEVRGLRAAQASGQVLQAWKAGAETLALRRQLEDMPDGGGVRHQHPREAPYRCPPGPYERASVVAAYFKRAKPRAKVLVLDANDDVTSKPALVQRRPGASSTPACWSTGPCTRCMRSMRRRAACASRFKTTCAPTCSTCCRPCAPARWPCERGSRIRPAAGAV